jgi:hypothetical protein
MRPLPDLTNTEAMVERGRRSHLGQARNEATEALRDAHASIQSADWNRLSDAAEKAREAATRLMILAGLWEDMA